MTESGFSTGSSTQRTLICVLLFFYKLTTLRDTVSWLFAVVPKLFVRLGKARTVVAITVVVSFVLVPLQMDFTQQAVAFAPSAESPRHGALVVLEEFEHGHSHEESSTHAQPVGHMHGHDPADHSHQFGCVAASDGQLALLPTRRWPGCLSQVVDPGTTFGIDRPPKSVCSA